MPSVVPQSRSLMITSCATSTRRRVRYPESAVLSAVSAKPLRAPCVEMKYSKTFSPSRKFEVIGVSITSPEGLAISPRMPESCRICCFRSEEHTSELQSHSDLVCRLLLEKKKQPHPS